MMKPIIFWGATGQAKVLREFIGALGYELVAVFDNNPEVQKPFHDLPIYYGREGFERWKKEHGHRETACLVAIGGARGRDRLEIQRFLELNKLASVVAVHPAAYVAASAKIGRGCQILARAFVAAEAEIGDACIINTAANIEHESILGAGVHVSVGANLGGRVTIEDYSLIGIGAIVLPNVRIGSDCIVGAGAVVTKDVPDGKVVVGNPARVVRDNPVSGAKIFG
jgi:sugar O-acyltransferase (sialic acid O-acetyltransferase NeuD family)